MIFHASTIANLTGSNNTLIPEDQGSQSLVSNLFCNHYRKDDYFLKLGESTSYQVPGGEYLTVWDSPPNQAHLHEDLECQNLE